MEVYTGFARVYDDFMDNVPYEKWCDYICGILREYGIADGLVLDLGCGTGKMTRLLRARGYDMIGVDLSEEMLEIARERETEPIERVETLPPDMAKSQSDGEQDFGETMGDMPSGLASEECFEKAGDVFAESGRAEENGSERPILYLQQDMREFELYGTVRAVICLCDSLNYILEPEELALVFALVNNYLDPGGIFVFDLNTPYKYRELLRDSVFCENRETECFTWENYFDEQSYINEYALNFFVQKKDGFYERFEEFHYQRAYERGQIEELLKKAGLRLLAVYGEGTRAEPAADCERMYFVAQEQGKTEENDKEENEI